MYDMQINRYIDMNVCVCVRVSKLRGPDEAGAFLFPRKGAVAPPSPNRETFDLDLFPSKNIKPFSLAKYFDRCSKKNLT